MTETYPVQTLLDYMARNWPEASSPESEIVMSLVRFGDLIRQRTDRVLGQYSLTPAAFEVLVTLRSMPQPRELMPTELYRLTLLTSGGMTKVLGELERRGLVERVANPDDGRSRLVQMTGAGQALAEEVMAQVTAVDRSHFAKGADLCGLRDTIRDMVAVAEQADPPTP